jgi:hypothetical protein
MSEQVISIRDIKLGNRELAVSDLATLMQDLKDGGPRVPILVTEDLVLIDGLRRIKAHGLLGATSIWAVIAETYDEAIANLKLAHEGREMVGPVRGWEIFSALEPLRIARTSMLRSRYTRVPLKMRGTVPKEPKSKDLITDALNDYNILKYALINRTAEAGDAFAQELLKLMNTGEIVISTAISRLEDERWRNTGDIKSRTDQRALFESASRGLVGIVTAVEKLALPIKIPQNELNEYMRQIRGARGKLTSFINLVQKELNR